MEEYVDDDDTTVLTSLEIELPFKNAMNKAYKKEFIDKVYSMLTDFVMHVDTNVAAEKEYNECLNKLSVRKRSTLTYDFSFVFTLFSFVFFYFPLYLIQIHFVFLCVFCCK